MTPSPAPGAPRGRPAEVFVGRRAEVDEIAAALADADGGQPRIVAGRGRRRDGQDLAAGAGARRAAGSVPVARPCCAGAATRRSRSSPTGCSTSSSPRSTPTSWTGSPFARPARDPRVDPMAVGADLLGVLGALSVDRPAVVVIDDAQWADDLSVRAVVFALRRLRHDRVLVVLGVRGAGAGAPPDERGPGVDPRWERALASVGGARRLTLRGLDPTQGLSELAVALGAPLGSTGAAERLWRHTQGHPLHARTLVEELPPEVLAGTSGVLPAPRSLATVVLVRLSRATPDAQALTVAAAVLGETCPLARAAALAGLDDPGAALDDAVPGRPDRGAPRAAPSPASVSCTRCCARPSTATCPRPAAARCTGRPRPWSARAARSSTASRRPRGPIPASRRSSRRSPGTRPPEPGPARPPTCCGPPPTSTSPPTTANAACSRRRRRCWPTASSVARRRSRPISPRAARGPGAASSSGERPCSPGTSPAPAPSSTPPNSRLSRPSSRPGRRRACAGPSVPTARCSTSSRARRSRPSTWPPRPSRTPARTRGSAQRPGSR